MLEKIKSCFFIKYFFMFLNEKRKLKIIKYNKGLQEKVDINLFYYKIYSKKYILYETKTKGKEYDLKNNLIYEGEYLKGERNGKGKEYYYNKEILFEGEYLHGKKWNGKGYDINNNIIYELKNGKGYVKEYNWDNYLKYEGEYLNGEKNGKGKDYYGEIGGSRFEGEYLNGKRWNGKGYSKYNIIIYELKNGKGYVKEYNYYNYLLFEGEYLNGEKNGKGKEYYYKRDLLVGILGYNLNDREKVKFEGQYKNGERNGKGKEYSRDGYLIFEGEYLFNERRKGKAFIEQRLEYEGEYFKGIKWNGKGYDEKGNIIYEIKNGTGKVRDHYDSKLIFEGEYKNGKINGRGKEYAGIENKLIFEGEYENGKRNGRGKIYDFLTGNLIFEGEFKNGARHGKGKEYYLHGFLKLGVEYKNGKKINNNLYYFIIPLFFSLIFSYILYTILYLIQNK